MIVTDHYSPKNRACEFPSTRLKPFYGRKPGNFSLATILYSAVIAVVNVSPDMGDTTSKGVASALSFTWRLILILAFFHAHLSIAYHSFSGHIIANKKN